MFDKWDHGRVEPIRQWPAIALDTARSADDPIELEGLSASLLWVSGVTDGAAFVRLNDKHAARLPLRAHVVLSGVPMKRLFLDWEAQPGKSITLLYGAGLQVNPGNDVTNIERVIEPVTIDAAPARTFGPSAYYRATASAALNTVVTPAANSAGVRIDAVTLQEAGGRHIRVMAKTSAPSAWNDAAALTIAHLYETYNVWRPLDLSFPILLPAGLGLYEQADTAAAVTGAALVYEVL